MKIVWTLPSFDNPQTGGEKVLNRLIEILKAKDASIINIYQEDRRRKNIVQQLQLKIHNFKKLLKQERHAFIFQNLYCYHEYILSNFFMHFFLRRKIILFINEIYEIDHLPFIKKLYHFFRNYIRFKTTSLIVVNSKFTGNWVCHFGKFKKKIYVMYPVFDIAANRTGTLKKANSELINILCVGNIRKNKGQIILIKALESIHHPYKVIIAGLAKDREYMEKLVEFIAEKEMTRKVVFTGFLNGHELVEQYQKTDIFVSPTLKEGFGMAIFEAMSFGLPVVASNVGGIREQVTDGSEGFLVPPNDPASLSDRMQKLITNRGMRIHMGQRAYKRSTELPRWDKECDELYQILLNL